MKRKYLWKKAMAAGCAGLLAAALLAGCGAAEAAGSSTATESSSVSAENESTSAAGGSYVASEMSLDTTDMFTDRDLDGTYDEAEAVTVSLSDDGSTASDDSVAIDGQTITIKEEGVYVFSGTLSDGQIIVEADDTAKVQIVLNGCDITCENSAAIYVRSADKVFLTLADGTTNTLRNTDIYEADGEEEIDSVIYVKDDLTINGKGELTIHAANGNGIRANDDLKLVDATLTIDAADHAVNANDSIRVYSGTYTLTAGTDGLHVSNDEDGEKGYIYIQDGTFSISSSSDGMDATGMIQIDGGTMEITAGDDGIHSEAKLLINDGTVTISECEEGLEGYDVVINDGDIDITSNDDGINATSGNGDGIYTGNVDLSINGGVIYINTEGDGIDSNGTITITGGETCIDGPSGGGNGSMDVGDGYEATITGGTVIAAGADGMAENFGSSSTQGSILQSVSSTSGEITLTDSDGNELAGFTPSKTYGSVLISTPDIEQGETYTLTTGETQTVIEMTELQYGQAQGMGGGPQNGGLQNGGGQGMQRPDGNGPTGQGPAGDMQ